MLRWLLRLLLAVRLVNWTLRLRWEGGWPPGATSLPLDARRGCSPLRELAGAGAGGNGGHPIGGRRVACEVADRSPARAAAAETKPPLACVGVFRSCLDFPSRPAKDCAKSFSSRACCDASLPFQREPGLETLAFNGHGLPMVPWCKAFPPADSSGVSSNAVSLARTRSARVATTSKR